MLVACNNEYFLHGLLRLQYLEEKRNDCFEESYCGLKFEHDLILFNLLHQSESKGASLTLLPYST
jgi:hypothetical protein